jgi:hypothetical protein
VNPDTRALVESINRLSDAMHKGPLDYVSLGVLVLTLIAVIYYTAETARLRTATQKQVEANVRPVIGVRIEPPDSPFSRTQTREDKRLVLHNDGVGPAFNIVVEDFTYDGRVLQFDWGSGVIRPGESRHLVFHLQDGNTGILGTVGEFFYWMTKGQLPDPTIISVHCISGSSKRYSYRFSFEAIAGRVIVSLKEHPE